MNSMMAVQAINQIDWALFSGPEYYDPTDVPKALIPLIELREEAANIPVYHRVLFAIGNNHAGTYYPAVVPALKFITETALSGNSEVARNCALNILIDLRLSFCPEIGNSRFITEEALEHEVLTSIDAIKEAVAVLAADTTESARNRQLAAELLLAIG